MRVLATLASGDYFYGVAALVNSVVANGTYVDKVVVGYRGALPGWLPPLSPSRNGLGFTLAGGLAVEFVEVAGDRHMTHEKPAWFRLLTEVLEPDAEEFFYMDSDIVVVDRMDFFGRWVRQGVAFCEDVNHYMSDTNPIRLQWISLLAENGRQVNRRLNSYVNGGFLGWTRHTAQFIADWEECFRISLPHAGDTAKFTEHTRLDMIMFADQDSMNIAAMTTDCPVSIIGPSGMSFTYGVRLMAHALGPKPWSRKFIADFFHGLPPRYIDLKFWEYLTAGPLVPFSRGKAARKVRRVKFLRFMSRFYRRSNTL